MFLLHLSENTVFVTHKWSTKRSLYDHNKSFDQVTDLRILFETFENFVYLCTQKINELCLNGRNFKN